MEQDRTLYEQLKTLAGETCPFHMPGHKRRAGIAGDLYRDAEPAGKAVSAMQGIYDIDLTEIEGADDLHAADGILRAAMDRTGALWGSRRTWYLVNGSTVGILAGIRALAPFGSRVIAARNCHRSVFHAIELGGLDAAWICPQTAGERGEYGICGSITPEQVQDALRRTPGCRAVIITSPTYEGVVSDIRGIADVCHAAGAPLFVDEAHGAHLGFDGASGGFFPESALHLGADLVVQSTHKTLPALTQTALLHLGTEALPQIREEEIGRQLQIFETSSPSYPLMASIDACTRLLSEKGTEMFAEWEKQLRAFDDRIRGLRHLRVFLHGTAAAGACTGVYAYDPGKILVLCGNSGYTGPQLMRALRERFGIEAEMMRPSQVLLMTSPCDGPDAYASLADALCALDAEAENASEAGAEGRDPEDAPAIPAPLPCMTIAEAVRREGTEAEEASAAGKICGEYLYAYPPGIPILAPGERILPEHLRMLREEEAAGTVLVRSSSGHSGRIRVLKQ